jgi:hypothetical protein
MTNDKTKYASVEPVELDIELSNDRACSYAHRNTAEPCWGAVVFRGIAPTCVGHSKMMSDKFYLFQDRVEKGHTTGGTLRLSINRGSKIPEELKDMWDADNPCPEEVCEVSVDLFPDMARPEVVRPAPPQPKPVEVETPVPLDHKKPIKITVSDDTEIPEVWKDYL